MRLSSICFLALVFALLAVIIEARGTKSDKHGGRRPGGHSPHHHPGGRSRHRNHGHEHRHGQDYGYDTNGLDNGHRHRRDITNGAASMNDTMSANETTTLPPGKCTKRVSVTITFRQSYQQSRKIQTTVRCGWLHLAKCRIYRLGYELLYRQATRVAYAQVLKCCPDYYDVGETCQHIGGRTTPSTTRELTTTPEMNATTTVITTTEDIPDDYKMMVDDKIQKLVAAIIILILIVFTGCVIGCCVIFVCKLCAKNKKNYV